MVLHRDDEAFAARVDPYGEVLRAVCADYRRIRIRAIAQGQGDALIWLDRVLELADGEDPAKDRDVYAAVVRDIVHRIIDDLPLDADARPDATSASSSAVERVCPRSGGQACTAKWTPQAEGANVPVCEIGGMQYRRPD